MHFNELALAIHDIDSFFINRAKQSINLCLTIRNWIIGYYIQEYELGGNDRAHYGEKLLDSLATELQKRKVPSSSHRSLKLYRQFYQCYPSIGQAASAQLDTLQNSKIGQTLSAQFKITRDIPSISIDDLIKNLSFSHFVELMKINDLLKRCFYELECTRGNWSTRELKRQIASLYYERSALSKNKKKLIRYVEENISISTPADDIIKDPYIFEFLGLKPKEVMYESDLSSALLDKLQEFLLELGKGFCFEARNKRILIGNDYYFIDAVFYHRILKCHILIELKLNAFNHENIGQLKTYINYYKKHEMTEGDNPPIGILLCTEKNHALVEYALGDEKSERLFVSKYQLELPSKDEMKNFLEKELQQELESK
jgi:predicted nuclease of restriction endonuclease-like (RecB) superfamily